MYRGSKNKRLKKVGASAALAAGLFAGGVTVASAATSHTAPKALAHQARPHDEPGRPGGPGGPGGAELPGGTVSALGAGTITVTLRDGTSATFTITSATTVNKDHAAATVSDLAVGESVVIMPSAPGATNAALIVILEPQLGGKVVSVTGSVIVVADQQGFYRTINVSGATTYTNGSSASSLANIAVGDVVEAKGVIDADHTSLDASAVMIGAPNVPNVAGPDGFVGGH